MLKKEYILRLLPVAVVLIILAVILAAHSVIKTKAMEADADETLRAEQREADEDEKEREAFEDRLTEEIYAMVKEYLAESVEGLDLSSFMTKEEYDVLIDDIETNVVEKIVEVKEAEEDEEDEIEFVLTASQKEVIHSMIENALSSATNVEADYSLSDDDWSDIKSLVKREVKERADEELLTDKEIAEIKEDIKSDVYRDVLSYVASHIRFSAESASDGAIEVGEGAYVSVDYLLTDEDKDEISRIIIEDDSFGELLSEKFTGEIDTAMTELVKEQVYNNVYEAITTEVEEKISQAGADTKITVAAIEAKADAIDEMVEALRNIVDENSQAITENAGAIAKNEGLISENKSLISENKSAIDETNASLDRVSAAIDETNSALESNSEAIEENSAAIGENKSAIEENSSSISSNRTAIENNENAIAENKSAIDENRTGIAANKTSIAANKSAIDSNKSTIETNKSAIESNKTAIETNKSAIETNSDGIESNRIGIAENKTTIDEHTETIGEHTTAIEEIERAISTVKLQIESVEDSIKEAVTSITDHDKRIKTLEQNPATVRYDASTGLLQFMDSSGAWVSYDRWYPDTESRVIYRYGDTGYEIDPIYGGDFEGFSLYKSSGNTISYKEGDYIEFLSSFNAEKNSSQASGSAVYRTGFMTRPLVYNTLQIDYQLIAPTVTFGTGRTITANLKFEIEEMGGDIVSTKTATMVATNSTEAYLSDTIDLELPEFESDYRIIITVDYTDSAGTGGGTCSMAFALYDMIEKYVRE